MSRLVAHAIAATLALAACHHAKPTDTAAGGSGSGSTTAGEPSGSVSPYARKHVFSFGITQKAANAEIFLQSTDERGATTTHSLGTFDGTCQVGDAAASMGALLAVTCKAGATGTQLQIVRQADKVLVMKVRVDDGVTPDPMGRDQIHEVDVPPGTGVEVSK